MRSRFRLDSPKEIPMNWTEEDLELLEYPPILRQPLPCKDHILSTGSPFKGFCHLLSFPVEP